MDFNTVESNYYKLISDYQFKLATPLAEYNDSTGTFDVHFKVKKDNRTSLGLGAVVSNGSSSMVYIGGSYKLLGKVSGLFRANFYYGRFYASAMLGARMDVPTYQPFALDFSATLNRYDFFKGSSRVLSMSFQPPYIIDYESNLSGCDNAIVTAFYCQGRFCNWRTEIFIFSGIFVPTVGYCRHHEL